MQTRELSDQSWRAVSIDSLPSSALTSGDAERDLSIVIPYGGGHDALLLDQIDAVHRSLCAAHSDGDAEILISCNRAGLVGHVAGLIDGSAESLTRVVDSSDLPGPSHARNVAVRAARGQSLLFCDSDDIVNVGWVHAMRAQLALTDAAVGGLEFESLNRPNDSAWRAAVPQGLGRKFRHLGFGVAANFAMQRASFLSVGGFDPLLSAGEDVDLCWRLQYEGFTLGYAPDARVSYRLRAGTKPQMRQAIAYGLGDAQLMKRHQKYGARRTLVDSVRSVLNVGYLVLRSMVDGSARPKAISRIGQLLGRVAGSVRFRVWAI